ncbi:hypothetical protein [Proteiniphilum acetatigenes]|uniref:hypothetical protein n=1 Tax=Proteiniphilum acetatigenes TaxID=294710 RepID=UPI00036ACCDC|nr:hypothetical protein [Proteiniphilum acetatigenes]SFK71144.1 hypothetical protein SAMN05216357_10524 [Porphyromonadaceae bacterium KH3CP3RA]
MNLSIPPASSVSESDYLYFMDTSCKLLREFPLYMAGAESADTLEIAHLIPAVPETVLAIYIGINDVVCNKGLVSPFLPRHSHNNVFVFDPQVYSGDTDVPTGTIDAKKIINDFSPPNDSWSPDWTYVMIADPGRMFDSVWKEKGYIDMIPAKFEDFTMLSDTTKSKVCIFIDPGAFDHPVNKNRPYLTTSRKRGERMFPDFIIPEQLAGENKDLVPVVLEQGEKLYVAKPDFQPCDHGWTNIHPQNSEYAVVNENSAVPLNLVISKPPVNEKYKSKLNPPSGSADSTTDWFYRSDKVFRKPVKAGHIGG